MSRTPNDVSGASIVADLMAMIKRSNVGVSLENEARYGSEGILPSAAPRGREALAPMANSADSEGAPVCRAACSTRCDYERARFSSIPNAGGSHWRRTTSGVPCSTGAQRCRQRQRKVFVWIDAWLDIERLDLKYTIFPVRFWIKPPDQRAPMQDGQCEIAIASFGCRCITLDAIVEAKQFPDALPIPHDRIER